MHEYELLEKRWKKYKIKKAAQKIALIAVVVASIYLLYRLFSHPKGPHQPPSLSPQTNLILPNFDFEKHLKAPSDHAPRASKQHPPATSSLAKKRDKLHIQAQGSDIDSLRQAFERHPGKNLALLIAQKYYDLGKYHKALEWSVKANEFDKSEERSWIIFAKSAYKIGDKRRAMDALRAYLRHHPSPIVKRLYLQMQKGTFR